jgi:iron complex outermembrane receptor protein
MLYKSKIFVKILLKKVKMKFLVIFLAVLLFAGNEDFLKTLNEVSEIATESKLNIDKTPSNVDVIDRSFIVSSGAKTLLDVLKYLPSIEIAMTPSGKKQLIIRGNKSAFRDKIKLMINGVEVTNNLYNNQFFYYNFPASLIKRIEFTKTPDSILYGENAFLGVLNIITLDSLNDSQFSFYASSKKEYQATFFQNFNNLLIDGYYSYSNPTLYSPTDYLINIDERKAIPFRSGVRINSLEKTAGIGIRYFKDDSTIYARFHFYKKGNFYGLENVPPLIRDRDVKFFHSFIEYKNSKYIRYDLKNELRVGLKHYTWDGSYRLFPYDLNASSTHDIIAGAKIPEFQIYLKELLKYEGEKNNINFILDMKYAKPYDYEYYQYIDGITPKITTKNLFSKKVKRKAIGVGVEDLLILKDNLSFILGYRVDHYNDFGSKSSYKAGAVYNYNDSTTFKLLYNNAFRVPSWVELYADTISAFHGNENLKPETISMWEFIFLKTFKNDKLKVTLYKGVNKNFIGRHMDSDGNRYYENLGDNDIKGIEIGYRKFYRRFQYYISYSINDNKPKLKYPTDFLYDYIVVRKRQFKGWGIYKFNQKNKVFMSFIYGSKINMPTGYVKDIGDYVEIDANYQYKFDNTNLIFGVNNLTDHKNYMPVYPSDFYEGKYFFEYKDARIPYVGRKFYVEVVRKW